MLFFKKQSWFIAIFVLCLLTFLAHTAFTKTSIFADAKYYYSITHSIVRDFDLNFDNQYQFFRVKMATNKDGLPLNFYPPGVALLWIPAFLLAEGLARTLNLFSFLHLDSSGFGLIHQTSVAATNIFLGVSGLYLMQKILKRYFSDRISQTTILSLFFATNLLFYLAVEPINSHAASFFFSAVVVYLLLKNSEKTSLRISFLIGLASGFAGVVRTQDVLLLPVCLIALFVYNHKSGKALLPNLISLFLGFITGFLPQVIFWRIFYDTLWRSPYLDYGFTYLTNPQILHVLLNRLNGIFTITSILFISFLGVLLFTKKDKVLAYLSLSYFLIQLYLISSWRHFDQGGSYAIRMMITTYPFLSFGLAQVLDRVTRKLGPIKVLGLVLFWTLANVFLIIHYLLSF